MLEFISPLNTLALAEGLPLWLPAWRDAGQGLQGFFTAAAIAVGGLWAYYRFVRGRTFRERLQIEIDANFRDGPDASFLRLAVRSRNIGDSAFEVRSALVDVSAHVAQAADSASMWLRPAAWTKPEPLRIFGEGLILEPGETKEEQHLLEMTTGGPGGALSALKLEVRVYSSDDEPWLAERIVFIGASRLDPEETL